MRRKKVRDLLSHQTDLILLDENLLESPITSFDSQDDQLDSLLELAAALKETLVPLTNPTLKPRVRDTLANYSKPEVLLRTANGVPAFWIILAAAGSIISLVSIIVLVLRKAKLPGTARLRPPIPT